MRVHWEARRLGARGPVMRDTNVDSNGSLVAGLIPIVQAAKLLLCTEQWITKLCRDGFIPRPSRGMVPLVDAVQGYFRYRDAKDAKRMQSASDSRVKDMRADELALRIEERTQALIKKAEAAAVAVVDDIAGVLRSDLSALPARVTNDVALRRKIEDGIDEAFDVASRRAGQRAAGLRAGRASLRP